MESRSDQPPLVAIVGETASGKSALGLKLAKRFNGEVICADSWTVRREVNIGAAKPTTKERQHVPHHLIDIVSPCEDFNAAVFKQLANQAILDISKRGKLSIMAGGTGLYVDSVVFDYSFLPAPSEDMRDELNALTIDELVVRIEQEGLSLEGIDIRNKRRLIRLLESGGARPNQKPMRPRTLVIGVAREREDTKRRIAMRVDRMLDEGLEDEVRRLYNSYGWECEALKGIGYQEWREYFLGTQDLHTVRDRIIKDTIDLAKRQRTWFKRNKSIHWTSSFEESVELVTTFLDK